MSFLKKTFTVLLAVMLFVSPGYRAEAKTKVITVTAEGVAAFENGDLATAKRQAKLDLFRNAAAKALGTYVESFTKTEDYMVALDRVYSQSQGVVSNYRIISEGRRGDMYVIRAKCDVAPHVLDGVLGPALIEQIGNPRILLVTEGDLDGKQMNMNAAEHEIAGKFHRAGYIMLDRGRLKQVVLADVSRLVSENRVADAGVLAAELGADVVLYLRASDTLAATQRIEGIRIHAVASQVDVRAVSASTAMILAEEHASSRGQGTSVRQANDKALGSATGKIAGKMVTTLAYNLANGRRGTLGGRTMTVTIGNLSFSQSRRLKKAVANLSGVISVFQRKYSAEELKMDVTCDMASGDLAEALCDLGIEVTDVTADTVGGILQKEEF